MPDGLLLSGQLRTLSWGHPAFFGKWSCAGFVSFHIFATDMQSRRGDCGLLVADQLSEQLWLSVVAQLWEGLLFTTFLVILHILIHGPTSDTQLGDPSIIGN